MSITVECNMTNCPQWDVYNSCIQTMLQMEFPRNVRSSPSTILEAVSGEFFGTKQTRNGPMPSPEVQVSIRQVIREAIAHHDPIPVLVPWGGSKQGPFQVDIAEAMALKQIEGLRQRVEQHYGPGIEVRIRVEDLTDTVLFDGWLDGYQPSKSFLYATQLDRLAKVVSPGIAVVPETTSMLGSDPRAIEEKADYLYDAFHVMAQYPNSVERLEDADVLTNLMLAGWQGEFPLEQFRYFVTVYRHYYPTMDEQNRLRMLARYYAMIVTRRLVDGSGYRQVETPTGPITLYFGHPLPGADHTRRLYYRTLPASYQHTHHAPWIGKGYVKITDEKASPAVTDWMGGGLQFTSHQITLSNDDDDCQATIQADYHVV